MLCAQDYFSGEDDETHALFVNDVVEQASQYLLGYIPKWNEGAIWGKQL